jgi:hypothetical protein
MIRNGFFLLLCGLLLAACDKTIDKGTSGPTRPGSFSVQAEPYGAETVVRAMGAKEGRLLEAAQVRLADSLIALVSLYEEAPNVTRGANDAGMVPNALIRIAAYSGNALAAHRLYRYNTDGTLSIVDANGNYLVADDDDMNLPDGTYFFTAYSRNSATDIPPIPNASDQATATPPVDFLSGRVQGTVSSGALSLNFTLRRHFMRFKYAVTAIDLGTGVNISSVGATLTTNYSGVLDLTSAGNGSAVKGGAANSLTLSKTTYEIAYPGSDTQINVALSGTVSEGANSLSLNGKTIVFNSSSALSAAGSYILNINIRKPLKWATSNIYWDPNMYPSRANGQKGGMRFETEYPAPLIDPANPSLGRKDHYQGVFFRWGSLVGVSPSAYNTDVYWSTGNTESYWPVYTNSTSHYWRKDTSVSDPNTIPFPTVMDYTVELYFDSPYFRYQYPNPYPNYVGDICAYLGETEPTLAGYRMPTRVESTAGSWVQKGTWSNSSTTPTSADGTKKFDTGFEHEGAVFFPASGWRDTGVRAELREVSSYATYQTAETIAGKPGGQGVEYFYMFFSQNGAPRYIDSPALSDYMSYRNVRCIKR